MFSITNAESLKLKLTTVTSVIALSLYRVFCAYSVKTVTKVHNMNLRS